MTNELLLSLLVPAVYLAAKWLVDGLLDRLDRTHLTPDIRLAYVKKFFQVLNFAIALMVLGLIWGVSYGQILLLTSSLFAVLGVALFAEWSILSNLTASILIFFYFPYRIGDFIKVLDGDNSVRGEIIEITMFHVLIRTGEQEIVTYPNNLILRKPVIKSSVLPPYNPPE